jgi:hypothetical protein
VLFRSIEGSPLQSHTTLESLTPILTAGALMNLVDQITQGMVVCDSDVVVHKGEVIWHWEA